MYNLPETVKEGDIEKLSFALELTREFSGRAAGANGRVGAGGFERRRRIVVVVDDDDEISAGGTRRSFARSCLTRCCG